MAQWKETLEPYVKVQERVKTATLNPTAGEDLIIGVAFISDAGPSTPTLITSQSEFLSTYASKDLDQEYIESLNNLYNGEGGNDLASTMWSNAYRLAGSNSLLCVRASKGDNLYFTKPLTTETTQDTYILRDGELLKKVPGFNFLVDDNIDNPENKLFDLDGWNINISGIGIFGNRVTNGGVQYDYYCQNLVDLVKQLNDTSMFFCPDYEYTDENNQEHNADDEDTSTAGAFAIKKVSFTDVFLGKELIDDSDPRTQYKNLHETSNPGSGIEVIAKDNLDEVKEAALELNLEEDEKVYYSVTEGQTTTYYVCELVNKGMIYVYPTDSNNQPIDPINDLNGSTYSGFTAASNYAINVYNSTSELRVRIRKFNHNSVVVRTLNSSDTEHLESNGLSPYTVLPSTVANLNPDNNKTKENNFYEVAVYDPSISETVNFFNVGSQIARGDMEVSEINSLLSMIQLRLPEDDMDKLELDYYGIEEIIGLEGYEWDSSKDDYHKNDVVWYESSVYRATKDNPGPLVILSPYDGTSTYDTGDLVTYDSKIWSAIQDVPINENDQVTDNWDTYWQEWISDWKEINTPSQIYTDLSIGSGDLSIITISDSDLKRALDLIVLDEVYTTEGLCDLGNTNTSFQNYMANIAVNDNYFYPISTVMSTNYMVIGNSASKISQDSYKLYMSSPWDIDTGTLGWKFYAAPSVLYWETVAKNRRNNREFAPMFGQDNGTMQYQRPFTEFNKKTRQLLLSRKVNTVMWDVALQAWVMNDNYTKQIENTIMNDEGNSRLMIRISKAMPIILKQFLGKRISEKLCDSIRGVIDYFFKTNILTMDYSIDSYLITCNYDEALARQNKVRVKVEVKYQRALKYIEVFNEAIEVGMDFEG